MKSVLAIILSLFPVDDAELTKICTPKCEVSEYGLELIRQFEGYSPVVYKDVAGLDTIGFGHLIQPGEHFPIPLTPVEASKVLKKDSRDAQRSVKTYTLVPLAQGQYDALTSFVFNLGGGTYQKSSFRRDLNAKNHSKVPEGIRKYNKARVKGVLQPVKGLTIRRNSEAELYEMSSEK